MLLLLYAPGPAGKHAPPLYGITRLEKLLFLLEKEGGLAKTVEHYEFEPYKFGPFSSDVYDTLEALRAWALVEVRHRSITDHYEAAEALRLDDDLSDEEENIQAVPFQPIEKPARQEKVISLTEQGRLLAEKLTRKLSTEDWTALTSIKQKYSGLSLRHLIAYVYQTYPETATESELA